MRTQVLPKLGIAVALALVSATEHRGLAQYERRTPVVEAVRKTRNAVVTIKVEKKGSRVRQEVVGTGVIIDERGYVVTNRHVITGADKVVVHLADGTELVASILSEDFRFDLAVLKLPAGRRFATLPFAPSSDLMVGERVIAIGHPFGYTNTVSTGIVSALGREITMPTGETLVNLIQTDASINPGNSGGPLFNINGEFVGLNVALREGAQGIAFALPSETVVQVMSKMLSATKLARLTHGMNLSEVLRDTSATRQQVTIENLVEKGPATLAGLKRGDILLRVGEHMVNNRFDVERFLWDYSPGERVAVVYERDGVQGRVLLPLTASMETELVGTPSLKVKRPDWATPATIPSKGP